MIVEVSANIGVSVPNSAYVHTKISCETSSSVGGHTSWCQCRRIDLYQIIIISCG